MSIGIAEHPAEGLRAGRPPETVLIWVSWVTPAGGLERVALSLANGLARRGLRTVLAGPYSNNRALLSQIDPAIDFIDYHPHPTVTGLLRTERFLNQLIRSRFVRLISAHGSVFPLLRTDVPVMWTEHGLRYGTRHMLSGARGVLWRAVRSRLLSRDWQLVTVSRFVLDEMRRQLGVDERSSRVIYNGVSAFDKLRALPAPHFEPPYRLGYLGRLDPEKHPLDIFEIDSHLKRDGLCCRWSVFGDGSLMPQMRERAASHGEGRFEFCGVRDVADAFAAMDLLVFTSRGEMEGLPTVLMEAEVAGRPAFAWRATCIPEAAGANAVLEDPPFDLKRAASAIAAVLRAPWRIPAAKAERWRMDAMLDQYEALLSEALKRSRTILAAETR